MNTKSVMLTEDEISTLISDHGHRLSYPAANQEETIERINYLNKRIKAFKEPEVTEQVKSEASAAGWGNANGN